MKLFSEFPISLSHGQIAVFDRSLTQPFNDWSEQHSAQGFAWRPGSVSFAPVEDAGLHCVVVDDGSGADDPLSAALRVIDVPFEVPPSGKIEIAGISDGAFLDLDPGLYQLRFQNLERIGDDEPEIRLSFRRSASPVFKVVRADAGLQPGQTLLLTASPA